MSPSPSSRCAQDLILAAVQGEAGKVKELIQARVPVDALDSMGRTALISASYYGQREVIEALIAAGAALDFRCLGDERNRRTLAEWESRALTETVPDEAGQTALAEAAQSPMIDEGTSAEVLRRLLSAGADPKIPDVQGRTPLHQAAWRERPQAVRALLAGGVSVNAQDVHGYTPLMAVRGASQSSARADVLYLLRQAGADEAGRENVDLVWAAGEPDPDGVQSALERGADVNFVTKNGDTALLGAAVARSKSPEAARKIVEILLERGADPDLCRAGRGMPSIFPSIEHGDLELVEILLRHGADPSLPWRGATPLKYAKAYKQPEIVALLTAAGASAAERTKDRGLGARDGNFVAVLLNRGIEEVTAALAGEGEAFQGIQGKPVDCGEKALLIYQLKGHGWTVVEPAAGFIVNLKRAEDLSRSLGCEAIHLGVSDTAEMVQYTLFEAGGRVEWLYWRPKRGATALETFSSEEWEWDFGSQEKKRKPSRKTDPREILHRFLKSHDAYYMGPASRGDGGTQTFFEGWSSRELVRADVVRLG